MTQKYDIYLDFCHKKKSKSLRPPNASTFPLKRQRVYRQTPKRFRQNVKEFPSKRKDVSPPVTIQYVMYDKLFTEPVAVAVVTDEGKGIRELKNLAVAPHWQRKGYGRQMVEYLCQRYQNVCHTLTVGTGDSHMTISFYQNCGFVYSHTVPDFFTLHYDHPIVEDGKVLKDMYYFSRTLTQTNETDG